MVNTGADFGSDLWDLMTVARSHIPAMASAFAEAAGHVMDTGQKDDVAMALRVRTPFQELRNEYHRLLAESQDSMQKTSTALVEAINDYAETDGAAGDQLRNLITEYNNGHNNDFPNAGPGESWEVPNYTDPGKMEEADRTGPHYLGEPPTNNDAPDDKK